MEPACGLPFIDRAEMVRNSGTKRFLISTSFEPVPERPTACQVSMISYCERWTRAKRWSTGRPSSRSRSMKPSMFQSELSTPEESGQRPETS